MKNLKNLLWFNKKFIILGILLITYIIVFTRVLNQKSKYNESNKEMFGVVESFNINGNKVSLKVKGKERVIVNYYFKKEEEINGFLQHVSLGDKLKLVGEFKNPSNNTIPNTFNYKKYLNNQKIFYTFNATSYEVIARGNIFYKLKDIILKRIYQLENKEYYLVFLLGDKSLLESSEYNNYQKNGISHLLAISGMHIGVILAVLSFLLKKLKEKSRFLLIIFILLIFAFLTSFSASVLRAILFYILNEINKRYKLNYNNMQVLIITAFILLLINPFFIYDLGFIYSFVVCIGIFYYQEKITGNYIMRILKLSIISFLFSLPITALLNYEINITAIFLNIIFVPLISLIVYPFSLISFIMPFLSKVFSILIEITSALNLILAKLAININIPKIPIILIIVYYVLLLLIKNNHKLLFGLLLVIAIAKIIPTLDSNYYILYLDVGQGDSAILISPYKKEIVMIDTGGKINYKKEEWQENSKTYNISDNTIKFLKSLGITKIDYLILSHGDADHMGEAINLVNNLKVKKVIFNQGEFNKLEQSLINLLNKKKIRYYSDIKELNFNDNKLYFLNNKIYDNENDNSIVLYLEINNHKFLFMGDAGVNPEKNVLNEYNIHNIDFLKVGHHGSNTSSSETFIKKIKPQYSIISVGVKNRYGHPKESVLKILNSSKIYRTDLDGSIKIKLNKNRYKIIVCPP